MASTNSPAVAAANKFTARLPVAARQTSIGTLSSSATSIMRPASITRVSSMSNLIAGGTSTVTRPTNLNIRSVTTNQTVTRAVPQPSVTPRTTSIPLSTRVPNTRPASMSNVISPPIRLTQTSLGSPRSLSSNSFLTSVQRPTNIQGVGSVRPRPPTAARLPLSAGVASGGPVVSSNQSNNSRVLSMSPNLPNNSSNTAGLPPSRPQSNPGVSSTVARPVLCSSRPASTGPVTGAANNRASALGGTMIRSAITQSSIIRSDTGITVRAASADSSARPPVVRPQQYLINTPSMQVCLIKLSISPDYTTMQMPIWVCCNEQLTKML